MDDVLFARTQMATSLAFHIVFASVGIAMPICMVAAEVAWRRTRDAEYLRLARQWARGTAVLFAVGAVSGTVLSFQLGLLFPRFMEHAGPIVGMPFSMEGFAFFTEAIFLGLYLYGWERLSPRLHVAAGVVVALSGVASAAFVTIANAWMNAPRGFRMEGGTFVDVDPVAAMANPFAIHEVVHMALAAYMATAFAASALHAWGLIRRPESTFHRKALGICLAMAVPSALAQPLVGHYAGSVVAHYQPLKLAAMEGLVETTAWAPAHLGPISIPGGLSILAYGRPDAVVTGLSAFPEADWPHGVVHVAFQVMVIVGVALAGLASWAAWRWVRAWWRGRRSAPAPAPAPAPASSPASAPAGWWSSRPFLWALVLAGPLGFVALEAGWIVTEVGRQPWIIYGVLRTADAVTPLSGLWLPFVSFGVLYAVLAAVVGVVLWRQVRGTTDHASPPGALH